MNGLRRSPSLRTAAVHLTHVNILGRSALHVTFDPRAETGARSARLFMIGGLAGLAAAAAVLWTRYHERAEEYPNLPTTAVKRADVDAVVLTSGRIASSRSTEIHCMLERLELTAENGAPKQAAIPKEGASAIIELVPDGATVKKGEVICELDASDFEELPPAADHRRGGEVRAPPGLAGPRGGPAGAAVLSRGREGTGHQRIQGRDRPHEGRPLPPGGPARLVETDAGKGYASAAQVASDRQEFLRLTEKLHEMEMTLCELRPLHGAQGIQDPGE